jgi:serine/threonine protein kinase
MDTEKSALIVSGNRKRQFSLSALRVCPSAESESCPSAPLRTVLAGKYLVGRSLGQGGFGITIPAGPEFEMKIAVKSITRGLCLPGTDHAVHRSAAFRPWDDFFTKGREKFVDEAKALAKFSNLPGVVNVRDYFTANGTAYIVMEFLDGRTLKEISRERGKMPVGDVLQLLEPLFLPWNRFTLRRPPPRYIAGQYHRPREGGAKLLDFGAARQFSTKGENSNTINVKHGFAPEEQYRTRGSRVLGLIFTPFARPSTPSPPASFRRRRSTGWRGDSHSPNSLGANFTADQQAA